MNKSNTLYLEMVLFWSLCIVKTVMEGCFHLLRFSVSVCRSVGGVPVLTVFIACLRPEPKLQANVALDSEGMQGLYIAILTSLCITMDRYDAAGFYGLPPSNAFVQRIKSSHSNNNGGTQSYGTQSKYDVTMIKHYVTLLSHVVEHRNNSRTTDAKAPPLITKKRLAHICKRILTLPKDKFADEEWTDLKSYTQLMVEKLYTPA